MPLPLLPILATVGVTAIAAELFKLGKDLFGSGDSADKRQPPPGSPEGAPGTNLTEEQQRIKDLETRLGKVTDQVEKGNQGQEGAEANSADGRNKLDQILEQLQTAGTRNGIGSDAATPETEAANDRAVRDGLQQLRDTVGGADAANRNLAGGLMPGMGGMPGLGGGIPGMGGGMPGFGGGGTNPLLGGGPLPGSTNGVDNPLADTGKGHDQALPQTSNPLADGPTPGTPPVDPSAHAPNTPTDPGLTPAGHTAAPQPDTPQPGRPADLVVTTPEGDKTTAPNATVETALRAGLNNPAGGAGAAYQAAGITLPGDGADPGEVVPTGKIVPGDIARWDEPPRDLLVWGDGKLIDQSGKLIDIETALKSGVFNGFFHPPTSGSSTSNQQASASTTAATDTTGAQAVVAAPAAT